MTKKLLSKILGIDGIEKIETNEESVIIYWDKKYENFNDTTTFSLSDINRLVGKIFDDLENRTCENCKYLNKERLICNNRDNDITYIGWEVTPMPTQRKLLCHKWEAKTVNTDTKK